MWFFIVVVNNNIVGNISLKYLIVLYFHLFIIIFFTEFVGVAAALGV